MKNKTKCINLKDYEIAQCLKGDRVYLVRPLKDQPPGGSVIEVPLRDNVETIRFYKNRYGLDKSSCFVGNPYPVNTELACRETWAPFDKMFRGYELDAINDICFKHDKQIMQFDGTMYKKECNQDWNWNLLKWRGPQHMPADFSRIPLRVTGVQCRQLQGFGVAFYEQTFGIKIWEGWITAHDMWNKHFPKHPWSTDPWVLILECIL